MKRAQQGHQKALNVEEKPHVVGSSRSIEIGALTFVDMLLRDLLDVYEWRLRTKMALNFITDGSL